MNASNAFTRGAYELHFDDLLDPSHGYAFPCDAAGQVDMDALSERARDNYLYARAVMGGATSMPRVMQRH